MLLSFYWDSFAYCPCGILSPYLFQGLPLWKEIWLQDVYKRQVKPYDMISGKEDGEWKCTRVDVCDPCMDKLQELHGELERQFLHRKGKVKVVCD